MAAVNMQQSLFETAVGPHTRGLFAFICCHAPRDPEDIYQDTLLAAWQGFQRFRGEAQLKTWLYSIARYKCMDAMRGKYRRQALEGEEDGQEGRVAGFEEGLTTSMDLRQAIEGLPEEGKVLTYLIYGQGLSIREAAEVLNIPEGTVKSRLHSLRKRLRAGMEERA